VLQVLFMERPVMAGVQTEFVDEMDETAYGNFVMRGRVMDAATDWPSISEAIHFPRTDTGNLAPVWSGAITEDPPRIVRAAGLPHVYCVVKGRRRHVPYAEWWENEGWPNRPAFEIIEIDELSRIPLGPPCPVTIPLNGKSLDQIMRNLDLMRAYLGSLVSGKGIECGAGARPLSIPLQAEVTYVDAFRYGGKDPNSYPGTIDFSGRVQVDVIDRIESLASFQAESQDFVLASHVIEHTPNPIGALVAANRLLRNGGKLVLIIPDKSKTFDRPRETTPVSHLVLDHEDYQRDRDLAHYAEWHSRVVDGSARTALADWETGADLHYHCFTQASFMEFIAVSMKYARWSRVDFLLPTADQVPDATEFYTILHK
jgi:SAM-dependent methyltransferase